MRRSKFVGAIAVATTCALVGAASGIATSGAAVATTAKAKTAAAARAAASSTTRPDFGGRGGGMSPHSVSVQLNKAGTAFIEVTRDEGTVTAISGSTITLKQGTSTVTYKDAAAITVADGATVTRNDATAALTDIKVGDRVSISSSTEGTTVRACDPTFRPTGGMGRGGHGGHGGPPPVPDSSTDSSAG